MNREEMNDLPFGTDFTQRVIASADKIKTRRRHARRAFFAVAVVLSVSAGTLGALLPARTPADNAPHLVTGFDTVASDDTQTEPTDYLFPEAADLSQFSENYAGTSTDDTGTTSDEDQLLFADDTEDAGDSSI